MSLPTGTLAEVTKTLPSDDDRTTSSIKAFVPSSYPSREMGQVQTGAFDAFIGWDSTLVVGSSSERRIVMTDHIFFNFYVQGSQIVKNGRSLCEQTEAGSR